MKEPARKIQDGIPSGIKIFQSVGTVDLVAVKYNLTAKSIQALKGVSDLMKRNAKITISIEGHADERGTREYNLALGQRRAESVSNYLIANGINRNRLITKSYGEERPLSLGSNNSAWAKNRRVEIK